MHADAGKGAHLFSSRPAPEHRTALRSATRSPRSRLCAGRAARGGETRARRRDRTLDYAQSALLPRLSARSFVQGPISPSFKKFTHTPLPLYLAAARRAQPLAPAGMRRSRANTSAAAASEQAALPRHCCVLNARGPARRHSHGVACAPERPCADLVLRWWARNGMSASASAPRGKTARAVLCCAAACVLRCL